MSVWDRDLYLTSYVPPTLRILIPVPQKLQFGGRLKNNTPAKRGCGESSGYFNHIQSQGLSEGFFEDLHVRCFNPRLPNTLGLEVLGPQKNKIPRTPWRYLED